MEKEGLFKVINAFLRLLQKAVPEVHVLDTFVATQWEKGDFRCLHTKVNLAQKQWILVPVHKNLSHWILLWANIPAREMGVLDSQNCTTSAEYIAYFKLFMARRAAKTTDLHGKWNEICTVSTEQQDSSSSGAFLMLNAMALARGLPPTAFPPSAAAGMRMKVLKEFEAANAQRL